MCGIAGSINFGGIASAKDLLEHRGPDSFGIYQYENVTLVHRRLSIIDLTSCGSQPMVFENLVISYNGEVYNYNEIRAELIAKGYTFNSRSDTEVILKAFHYWGAECLNLFNGMFAFCIFNTEDKSLFIARDKIGIKPLYYYHNDDVFIFGSELKVFPKSIRDTKSNKALIQFLVLSYIPAPNSVYENVFKLEPGCYAKYCANSLEINQYWSPQIKKYHKPYDIATYEQAVKLVEDELENSLRMQMVADVDVGCFLSGGVDSSLIAALAQKHSVKPVKTYSIGFKEKKFDESVYASDVAKFLKTDHHTLMFDANDLLELIYDYDYYFDEPFGDSSSLPLSLLSKKARAEGITVALTGDGGDELFLGYDRYTFATTYFRRFEKVPKSLRYLFATLLQLSNADKAVKMMHPIRNPTMVNFYSLLYTCIKPWDLSKAINKDVLDAVFGKSNVDIFDFLNIGKLVPGNEKDLSDIDILRNLPDDMLTKSDRSSMRYSLEIRVPILDSNLVEISRAIPNELLLNNGKKKAILKEILQKHIPPNLIDRPKRGFSVPISNWLRNEIKGELLDLEHRLPDFINKNYVRQLTKEHINNSRNHSYTLWNLMRLKNNQ